MARAHPHRASAPRRLTAFLIPLALIATFALVAGGAYYALTAFDSGLRTGTCSASGLDTSHTYSTEQTRNAAIISAVGVDRQLPPRAASIALATAYQESKLENIDYGDRDSVGLFQQRPSQGWGSVEEIMDPVYASTKFYEALEKIDGYENMEITVAAQKVQRSAYPDAYADHEVEGRLFASALTGQSAGELQCDLAPAGGPGNPADVQALIASQYVRLSESGRVTSALGSAGDGAPEGAGATTLVITAHDSPELGWSLANWAVAQAAEHHIVGVDYQGQRWDRSRQATNDATQWAGDASGGADAQGDAVVIYFAGTP